MNIPVIIDNFITPDDCDHLIHTYKDNVQQSRTVNSITGLLEIHPARTSSTFFLPDKDSVVSSIKQKVSEYLHVPCTHIEGLQFLRYQKGEKYIYHHDYFKDKNTKNQRVHTMIVYLNDLNVSDGGATSFFHHSLKVQPKKGATVHFRNMDESNVLIETSLHSGEEILTSAIKYAINVWTRQHPV